MARTPPQLRLGLENEAVVEHARSQRAHVIGQHVVSPVERGARFGALEQSERGARAGAEFDLRVIAGKARDTDDVVHEFVLHVDALDEGAELLDALGREQRRHRRNVSLVGS